MPRPAIEGGFTLVELLITISILAILIAVVVPNVGGLLGGSKLSAFTHDQRMVQLAVDTYYLAMNPNKLPTANLSAPGVISFTRLVNSNILRQVPASASRAEHPDAPGDGSYIWYLDGTGSVTTTFNGVYP